MRSVILCTSFIALNFFALPAYAQMVCGPYADISKKLERKYQEKPIGVGKAGNIRVELWSSRKGESFTLVFVSPHKLACLPAVGEAWTPLKVVWGEVS